MFLATDESRVLVIYTGGTIGMLPGPGGYVPEPFYLTETLRAQQRFHDPLGDSLFSHSRSVEGFREWSGRNTPVNSPKASTAAFPLTTWQDTPLTESRRTPPSSTPTPPGPPTLLVRSSRPLTVPPRSGLSPNGLIKTQDEFMPTCKKVHDHCYEIHLPSLVTPASPAPSGNLKRIRYAILEWNPLLDSSNVEIKDWVRIAEEIELNYQNFDSFVVLHGTDTMAYSSSALSFLLEDLGKTVIITGAQIPLSQLRNDAVENLLWALSIAGQYVIPECTLFFNHALYRGNRVVKASTSELAAFNSPNLPPLATVGIDVLINWHDVVRPTSLKRFKAHKTMCPNVGTLRLFPGITASTVRAFLAPPIQGLVLETFGAGNAPQRKDLREALKEACDRGVIVVAISQCSKGSVSAAYETGRALQTIGVLPGGDMTPECALTKLAYLLSKSDHLSPNDIRKLISVPLRGELALPSTGHTDNEPSNWTLGETNKESLPNMLHQIARLSAPPPVLPTIAVSPVSPARASGAGNITPPKSLPRGPSLSQLAKEATSPWSNTISETASTEAALLPFLVHLAVVRDDTDALRFCFETSSAIDASATPMTEPPQPLFFSGNVEVPQAFNVGGRGVAGGVVNVLDSASGRTPLHVAALNGSTKCAMLLLKSGALVHLRDSLDHTALYYAARQGHETIVNDLVQAGAHLGGSDFAFMRVAVRKAQHLGDHYALGIWRRVGVEFNEAVNLMGPSTSP